MKNLSSDSKSSNRRPMPLHLVQLTDGTARRVAVVDEPNLRCLDAVSSVYSLAQQCLRVSRSLEESVHSITAAETLAYDDVYSGRSPWRLLPPIDVPDQPSRVLVSGTGLAHVGSARQRQAMHLADNAKKSEEVLTDSMRMFQWGIENGRPTEGMIGVARSEEHTSELQSLRHLVCR